MSIDYMLEPRFFRVSSRFGSAQQRGTPPKWEGCLFGLRGARLLSATAFSPFRLRRWLRQAGGWRDLRASGRTGRRQRYTRSRLSRPYSTRHRLV